MNGTATAIDLTPVIIAVIGGVFSVIGIVATAILNRNIKDAAAAATVGNAVKNSLGAIQQAIDTGVTNTHPSLQIPAGVTPEMATGVQYVLDHAGTEAQRLGITPEAVADKINAQLGLAKIAAVANMTTTDVTAKTPVQVTTTTRQNTQPSTTP